MAAVARTPDPAPASLRRTASGTVLLGKYQMGRVLGRGSFAKVQEAKHVDSGAVVAIKIIDKKRTVDAAMEPRIIGEIAAMRRLDSHPNVLKILEVMATKTKIYLVMEFAAGGELFGKVFRRGKLSEPQARRYFQQLASALRFCHQNGVVHRDVKPQNLLLDTQGNLKVSDFGLSALPDQLKNGLLHTACGTPAYIAPEVVSRKGYDGAKADAWSCGVILYVLLAGYLPFDDRNLMEMYRKIHRRDYRFPDWISKPARSIIYHLLDPNPERRMSIDSAMQTRWFRKSLENSNQEHSMFDSDSSLHKEGKTVGAPITAFDIISLSSGLNLSGLFEKDKRKMRRFTASVSMEGVVDKMTEIGERLGYKTERRNGDGAAVGLRREASAVVAEAVEITEAVAVVVEIKVVGGDVKDDQWEEMQQGFEEIVLSWHNEV